MLLIIPIALRPTIKDATDSNLEDNGDSAFVRCVIWKFE